MNELIINLHKAGKTINQIAAETKLSYMTIYHFLKRQNLISNSQRKWWTENTINDIKTMLEDGYTYQEIANKYNKKDYHILTLAKKYHFKSINNLPITDNEKQTIIDRYLSGSSIEQIEKDIRRGHSSISDILFKAQIIPELTQAKLLNKSLISKNQRQCGSCKLILPKSEFFNRVCKKCRRKRDKEIYKDKYTDPSAECFLTYRFKKAKESAKRRDILFNLTIEDLNFLYKKQQGRCFYSNRILLLQLKSPDALSIDRIDSNGSYNLSNCVLCTYQVNLMKSSFTTNEFIETCRNIVDHNNKSILMN